MVSFCSLVSVKSVILVTYLHFFFFNGSFAWWEGPIQGKAGLGILVTWTVYIATTRQPDTVQCSEYVACVCVKSSCVSAPMGPWECVLSQQPADILIESALLGTNRDLLSVPLC